MEWASSDLRKLCEKHGVGDKVIAFLKSCEIGTVATLAAIASKQDEMGEQVLQNIEGWGDMPPQERMRERTRLIAAYEEANDAISWLRISLEIEEKRFLAVAVSGFLRISSIFSASSCFT